MKRLFILLTVLLAALQLSAQVDTNKSAPSTIHTDTLKKPLPKMTHADSVIAHTRDSVKMAKMAAILVQQAKTMSIDTIRQIIKRTRADTLKAPLYAELASRYMVFDTLNDAKNKENQNNAISYTLAALHQYSAYGDGTGMRVSYYNLGKLYLLQKKLSEAKWFALQAIAMSRYRNDEVNLTASLLVLADVKGQIGDFKLAEHDLNEAMQLAINHHHEKTQLQVTKYYALLYSRMKDYDKEELTLKKYDILEKKIEKEDALAAAQAKIKAAAALKKKMQDSVLASKKQAIAPAKKSTKSKTSKKAN